MVIFLWSIADVTSNFSFRLNLQAFWKPRSQSTSSLSKILVEGARIALFLFVPRNTTRQGRAERNDLFCPALPAPHPYRALNLGVGMAIDNGEAMVYLI